MTASEQTAFNNGFILAMATKGLIKGNTITKTYYEKPTLNQGITMADRPLIGNDEAIQKMIFNARAYNQSGYTGERVFIAYALSSPYPTTYKWIAFFSSQDTVKVTTTPNQIQTEFRLGDGLGIFGSNYEFSETNLQRNVWDSEKIKLPYIVYSTIDLIDSSNPNDIILKAPYNLFG